MKQQRPEGYSSGGSTGGGGRNKMTTATKGSRLSKGTKSAIKDLGISKEARAVLRQALRTPGSSAAERKVIRKSGLSQSVVSKQQRRSTNRAANRRRITGGRG